MRFLKLFAAVSAAAFVMGSLPVEAGSPRVKLRADLGQSAITAGKDGRVYLRVDLEGLPFERREYRTPVNIALVIDRSGSMRGPKLANAKEAAIMALGRLGPEDRVSVVAYDHNVKVLVPSTRAVNHDNLRYRIGGLTAGGRTALYAGVEQGLREVKRGMRRDAVNRIILLSDGLANVGPSSPHALGELGQRAAEDGISITTIGLGLGYNEDLMTKLAFASDGNHAFVERPSDLVTIFNQEFGDALSVVAQDVEIHIDCGPGIRPMRALGRKAEIKGSRISLRMNQLYGAQRKYFIVELETPETFKPGKADIADISVGYRDMQSKTRGKISVKSAVTVTESTTEAEASIDKDVMAAVATQRAVQQNEKAVSLRDKGRVDEARKVLQENAAYLDREAKRLGAGNLAKMKKQALDDASNLDKPGQWNRTRKSMRRDQYRSKTQQSY